MAREHWSHMDNLKAQCELMDTVRLGALMQAKKNRQRILKDANYLSQSEIDEKRLLGRELKMIEKVLQSRQMRMEGF